MANRKKEVYKPKPMTEGKRNLIQGLLQEYAIQSTEDIQEPCLFLIMKKDVIHNEIFSKTYPIGYGKNKF